MNHCTFAGNLTRDPELKELDSGRTVCSFGIALNEGYTKESGERVQTTEFIEVEAWNGGAKFIAEHFHKGDGIIIAEAKVKTETWEKDGQKRSKTKFNALRCEFPPGRRNKGDGDAPAEGAGKSRSRKQQAEEPVAAADGEIPF